MYINITEFITHDVQLGESYMRQSPFIFIFI